MMHYHEKIFTQVLNLLLDFLKIFDPKKLTCLVGNHDMINNQVFCDPDGNWCKILYSQYDIVYKPKIVQVESSKFLCVPYVFPGRFFEAIKGFDSFDHVVAHQEFLNCKMGAKISTIGDDYTLNQICFSGHIHQHQILGQVYYTGSAFEHSFGSGKCWLHLLNLKNNLVEKIESQVDGKHTKYVEGDSIVSNFDGKVVVKCNSIDEFKMWKKKNAHVQNAFCLIKKETITFEQDFVSCFLNKLTEKEKEWLAKQDLF